MVRTYGQREGYAEGLCHDTRHDPLVLNATRYWICSVGRIEHEARNKTTETTKSQKPNPLTKPSTE